jgi:phage protein D
MAFNLDKYAPAFVIEIDGQRQEKLERAVIDLNIEDSIAEPGMFTMNLYESLDIKTQEFKWQDRDILDPASGKEVKIYIGYANSSEKKKSPLITGSITALTPGFPATGIPTLSLQGLDHSFKLQKPGSKGTRTFKEIKDYADIVKTIANENGLGVGQIDPIVKIESFTIDSEKSDYSFLKWLADRFGYEFFVRNDKLYFRKPEDMGKEAITLAWGRELMSFSPRMSVAEVVSKVTVRGPDPKDRSKTIEGIASSSDLDFKEKGAKSAADYIKSGQRSDAEAYMHDIPICSEEEAKAVAKAAMARKNNNFITGTCQCIGIPDVRPGTNVKIEGVGKRFNGIYYIKKATHSLGDGGYTTSLEICRGGIGVA